MAHVLPSGGGKALMNTEDSVLLLLDHQSGLFQTVKDITVAELRANVCALARIAALLKLPVITTASVPDGPNGPLMPETAKLAPHAVYVPRQGEVNAWDNDLFVKTVRETGKKTLIMAGVWTSVCVMFPALDAKAAGFNVYAVIDASGDPTEMVSRTTLARFIQSGVVPTSTNAVICELHRTWRRPEAAEIADIYTMATPNYRSVMESFDKAKAVMALNTYAETFCPGARRWRGSGAQRAARAGHRPGAGAGGNRGRHGRVVAAPRRGRMRSGADLRGRPDGTAESRLRQDRYPRDTERQLGNAISERGAGHVGAGWQAAHAAD